MLHIIIIIFCDKWTNLVGEPLEYDLGIGIFPGKLSMWT